MTKTRLTPDLLRGPQTAAGFVSSESHQAVIAHTEAPAKQLLHQSFPQEPDPYIIASHYSSRERSIIERGLLSFQDVSCIRFVPRTNQRDYLNIQSINGCYSYVGRLGYGQAVSLDRQGCLYHNTVQHELLHALGFNHEQCRSDRDQHIRILWENIASGWEYAFDKINTLNQNTPYDYNSVMQYHRYAFSGNNKPTMEPIPNPNVEFGTGTEMSQNDITRLNRLYKC